MLHVTCHEESARSIGYRSDTLTTHISIDQINHLYYNTILKGLYYTLIILDNQ